MTKSIVWLMSVTLCIGAGACAASTEDGKGLAESATTEGARWTASERSRREARIDEWRVVASEGADGTELFGLGATSDATKAIVRVHAQLRRSSDGRIAIAVDVPSEWRFEYVPGSLPTVSGEIPKAIAFALASSALDAPASDASAPPVSVALAPRNSPSLVGGGQPTCLIQRPTTLVPGSAEHQRVMGEAFAILQQFEQCRTSDGVVSPTDPAERAQYERCVSALADAGCRSQNLYLPILDGVAAGSAQDTGTSGPTDAQYGRCAYWSNVTVNGVRTRCLGQRIEECSTRFSCEAVGGTFSLDDSCSGQPLVVGGCGG